MVGDDSSAGKKPISGADGSYYFNVWRLGAAMKAKIFLSPPVTAASRSYLSFEIRAVFRGEGGVTKRRLEEEDDVI